MLVLLLACAYGVCALRIACWWMTSTEMDVPAGTKVLCVGSSQIGCSLTSTGGGVHLLWRPSVPIQFAWMRLAELSRRGILGGMSVVVCDLNFSTIGVQQEDNLERYWVEMLPVSWRHPEKIAVSPFRLYSSLLLHVMDPYDVSTLSERVNPSKTLAERDDGWINDQWNRSVKNHDPDDSMLVTEWKDSIVRAVMGINEICQTHHIRLIVLSPPTSSRYLRRISSRSRDRMSAVVALLKENGIEYVDASASLPDQYFIDLVHLSSVGSQRFSESLFTNCGLNRGLKYR